MASIYPWILFPADDPVGFQVSGYGTKLAGLQRDSIHSDSRGNDTEGSILSGFQALADIIISLVNNDRDGRILLSGLKLADQREEKYIKFVMLSGERIFSEVYSPRSIKIKKIYTKTVLTVAT